jgi:hypothetical protein
MMNKNVLLQDIKSRRKSKVDELDDIQKEINGLESKKQEVEMLITDYDELIKTMSDNKEEDPIERLNIDDDIMKVFSDLKDGNNPLGQLEGLMIDEVYKHLVANKVDCSRNTVISRFERFVEENKLYQVNAPQTRYRKYARVISDNSQSS